MQSIDESFIRFDQQKNIEGRSMIPLSEVVRETNGKSGGYHLRELEHGLLVLEGGRVEFPYFLLCENDKRQYFIPRSLFNELQILLLNLINLPSMGIKPVNTSL